MEYKKTFWITIALLAAAIASIALFIHAADIYGTRENILLAGIPERSYHAITARNTQYDAAVFGSSVSENFKCSEIDRAFDVHSMKFTLQGGSVTERAYIWNYVNQQQPLKLMISDIAEQTFATTTPNFRIDQSLYETNHIQLREYLSADNLKNAIYKIFLGVRSKTDRDGLYTWHQNFEFGKKRLARLFYHVDISRTTWPESLRIEDLQANLRQTLLPCIRRRQTPDSRIIFFFPPYSILHYQPNALDRRMKFKAVIMDELLAIDGLDLYDFQAAENIVCNLGLYRDDIHYDETVNSWIVSEFASSRFLVTPNRKDEFIERHRQMVNSYDYAATAAELKQLAHK